jgi:hypothetical protein
MSLLLGPVPLVSHQGSFLDKDRGITSDNTKMLVRLLQRLLPFYREELRLTLVSWNL